MYTPVILAMLISCVLSQDALRYEPVNRPALDVGPAGDGVRSKPSFCNSLDCPAYTVLKTTKEYEVREYDAANWVSTDLLDIQYRQASYVMFMRLFKYIGGMNDEKKKIAMTCPVINRIIPGEGPACESNFTMSFYVAPNAGQIPQPSDNKVFLSQTPKAVVYVKQFDGFAMDYPTWQKQAVKLGTALDKDDLNYEKAYYYTAGYDAPFKLFNRHNEVWFLKK